MSINVNAERAAVARLSYRFDCESDEEWMAKGPWEDKDWDELLLGSEQDEYRRKAMALMDMMIGALTSVWQVQRLDETDEEIARLTAALPKLRRNLHLRGTHHRAHRDSAEHRG